LADLLDGFAFDQHGVDDIASQIHAHGPPWSCPLCLATGIRDLLKPDTSERARSAGHSVADAAGPARLTGFVTICNGRGGI
jgi:hypothetical protein